MEDVNNNSELSTQTGDSGEESKRGGFSLPYRNFETIYDFVSKVYTELGHDIYLTREQIAQAHGLAPNSIKQQLSASQSFGLMEIKHGTGYKTTELFARIFHPGDDDERKVSILESIRSFPLYNALLNHYEKSGILPNNTGITNTLIRQYGLSSDAATKGAKEFVSTLRSYGLLDDKNILRLNIRQATPTVTIKPQQVTVESIPVLTQSQKENYETVLIPLKNGRRAEVRLPNHFEDMDLKRIIKFLNALKDADEEDRNE